MSHSVPFVRRSAVYRENPTHGIRMEMVSTATRPPRNTGRHRSRSVVRPELGFLLRSARPPHGSQSDPGELPDWDDLIPTAVAHGMIPMLWRQLRKADEEAVPAPVLKRLELLATANALRARQLARQLVDVIDLLEYAGVRAIPVKGPLLAASVYGDLSARQSGDLDVLVHPDSFGAAGAALTAAGWQPGNDFLDWE